MEESKGDIMSADKREFKESRQLSVKSIPLFKNEANSFMDAIQNSNSEHKHIMRTENQETNLKLSLN